MARLWNDITLISTGTQTQNTDNDTVTDTDNRMAGSSAGTGTAVLWRRALAPLSPVDGGSGSGSGSANIPFQGLPGPHITSAVYILNLMQDGICSITLDDVRKKVTGRGGQNASDVLELLKAYGRLQKRDDSEAAYRWVGGWFARKSRLLHAAACCCMMYAACPWHTT